MHFYVVQRIEGVLVFHISFEEAGVGHLIKPSSCHYTWIPFH